MPTPLAELAVTFANHAYVSGVLAELETAWAADEADPAVRVHLARHGRHHSWHAELWTGLLPDSVRLADVVAISAPDEAWAGQLDALGAVPDTGARLALLYRSVIPRLLTATECLLDNFGEVSDAAASRVERFVTADLAAEQSAGSRLLHDLISGDALAVALEAAARADVVLSASRFGRCGA